MPYRTITTGLGMVADRDSEIADHLRNERSVRVVIALTARQTISAQQQAVTELFQLEHRFAAFGELIEGPEVIDDNLVSAVIGPRVGGTPVPAVVPLVDPPLPLEPAQSERLVAVS